MEVVSLIARQAAGDEMIEVPLAGTAGHCEAGNEYDGSMGLRISAIFVILIGSLFGRLKPPVLRRQLANIGQVLGFLYLRSDARVASFSTDSSLLPNSSAPESSLRLHLFT